MRKKLLTTTSLIAWMLMTGCGSVIHGPEQKITFSSNPSGAQVLYDGGVRGITPCQVNLKRRPLTNIVVVRKEGFVDEEIEVKTGVSMWALLGNALIGGIPGWIIDAATGSFGQIYTETFEVDLVPVDESTSLGAPGARGDLDGWRRFFEPGRTIDAGCGVGLIVTLPRDGRICEWVKINLVC